MRNTTLGPVELDFMPLVKSGLIRLPEEYVKEVEYEFHKAPHIKELEIQVELYHKDNSNGKGTVLSCMGHISVFAGRNNVMSSMGQSRDTMEDILKGQNELLDEVLDIWDKYHSNDLRPGSKRQTEFIEKHEKEIDRILSYEEAVYLLKENDLYVDSEFDDYVYGSRWLMEQIPQDIIDKILSWEKRLDEYSRRK